MFSVLMSIYKNDNPAWLKESIDSILGQTLKAGEVLIVKDGELTAELEQLLSQYNDPSIRYLTFVQNRGLALCLRDGIAACSYDLVARMDSDDVCHPHRFENQFKEFQKDSSIDVLGTDIVEFDQTIADATTVRQLPADPDTLVKWSRRRSPVNHASVMYKRQSVLAAGNYQNFLWNEDYHLWSRMLMNGCRFKNLNQVLLYVRGGQAMFQRRGGWKYAQQDIKLQLFFLKIGFVNFWGAFVNLGFRLPIRLLPNQVRQFVYNTFLRKKALN